MRRILRWFEGVAIGEDGDLRALWEDLRSSVRVFSAEEALYRKAIAATAHVISPECESMRLAS
jgi:hypothetical protein